MFADVSAPFMTLIFIDMILALIPLSLFAVIEMDAFVARQSKRKSGQRLTNGQRENRETSVRPSDDMRRRSV